jgi:hypothetical protein
MVAIVSALVAIRIVAATAPANTAPPTVETSSDRRFLLVSGKSRDDVLAAVNKVAEDGYQLVTISSTWRNVGTAGLACLLEKSADEHATEYQYAFAQGMAAKPLNREVQELAARGFRIPPWGLLARWADYIWVSAPKVFIVMERSGELPVREYSVVSAAKGRKHLIVTMERGCENGDRFMELYSSGPAPMMTFWERMPSTHDSEDSPRCDGRYEYVSEHRFRALREQLIERGNRGYRLVAASGLGLLLERPEIPPRTHSYRFPCTSGDTCEDAVATMNTWAREGFRLHARSPYFIMVKEHDPKNLPAVEYHLIGPALVHELLDALSAARADGFRVLRLLGDDEILLQRIPPPT